MLMNYMFLSSDDQLIWTPLLVAHLTHHIVPTEWLLSSGWSLLVGV